MTNFKPKRSIPQSGYKYHIVLSFNDAGQTFFVVKYYGKYKQWWHYEIWDEGTLSFNKAHGYRIVKHRTKKEGENEAR